MWAVLPYSHKTDMVASQCRREGASPGKTLVSPPVSLHVRLDEIQNGAKRLKRLIKKRNSPRILLPICFALLIFLLKVLFSSYISVFFFSQNIQKLDNLNETFLSWSKFVELNYQAVDLLRATA